MRGVSVCAEGRTLLAGSFCPQRPVCRRSPPPGECNPAELADILFYWCIFPLPVHFAREMATSETQQRRGKLPNDSCNQHGPSAWFTDRMHPEKWRVLGSVENLL